MAQFRRLHFQETKEAAGTDICFDLFEPEVVNPCRFREAQTQQQANRGRKEKRKRGDKPRGGGEKTSREGEA